MAGPHTLAETERQVNEKLVHKNINFEAMAVTSNLFRAANSVRNHLERTVLAKSDLSWTAYGYSTSAQRLHSFHWESRLH
ncbi:MAG: hypothetical protein RLZZ218_229 [Actinomycetota bacterium]